MTGLSHGAEAAARPPAEGAEAFALAEARLALLVAELPEDLSARMLTLADGDRLTAFRQRIVATLDDPDHYRMAGEVGNFIADHLGARGLTAGIFQDGELVAYGALGIPGPEDHNRGRDLPLPAEDLPLVAHMSSAMVDPAMRGRGLHHRLIDWRIAVSDSIGRRHLLTTVSPRNHRSWGHLAGHGLHPRRLIRVGEGLVRLLLHRDAAEHAQMDRATALLVPVDELAARGDLFDGGNRVWGRVPEGGDPATATRWYALVGRAIQTAPGRPQTAAA
ncbi:GNAT family N-acetyltransferase [Azospirillum thermophilum]|uniref:GNAT family N-acetyltransferase n=1 Tax=Azospirillum thermophilum TaxID=2202148 RepID=A0A2S2CRV3_9PROT|nr:GNAT family N-acetyltransferase [Azospirillum thermophilum]AWK87208.1 GNAT family N-acetyltransferase [Azospirillum thermophilum]